MNKESSPGTTIHGARGEDICKRTRAFAVRTITRCRTIQQNSASRVVIAQLVKSATSVGANVEEAQAAQGVADFVSKMQIALKEARETRYWYRVAVESQLLREPDTVDAFDEIEQIIRILYVITQRAKQRPKT